MAPRSGRDFRRCCPRLPISVVLDAAAWRPCRATFEAVRRTTTPATGCPEHCREDPDRTEGLTRAPTSRRTASSCPASSSTTARRYLATHGTELGGLRYDFCGREPTAKPTWSGCMIRVARQRPVPEVMALLSNGCSHTCSDRGTPQQKSRSRCPCFATIRRLRLFSTVVETAEQVLGTCADSPDFECHRARAVPRFRRPPSSFSISSVRGAQASPLVVHGRLCHGA